MEHHKVKTADEVVAILQENPEIDISEEAVREAFRVWEFRKKNGSHCFMIAIPNWLGEAKFNKRRPIFFGKAKYDNPEKGAVLFEEVYTPDISLLEAGMWNDVTITEMLEAVDISEAEDSYVDEPGLLWSPRKCHVAFKYVGPTED